jgi:hypothetical protein
MEKTTKKCNNNCKCSHVDAKTCNTGEKETINYGFYSKVLNKPFDSLSELMAAEDAHFAEQRAKADKAAQKKTDAQLVEEAFKALNKARKIYKEAKTNIAAAYAEDLKRLKADFEADNKLLNETLAEAEEIYAEALNTFTEKYPEGYHLTLKDGDFETTISSKTSDSGFVDESKAVKSILDLLFGW